MAANHKNPAWQRDEIERLVSLYQQGLGNQAIADTLGRSLESVGSKIARMRTRLPHRTYPQKQQIYGWADHSQDDRYFDEPRAELERQQVYADFQGKEWRCLVLSDIHGLFRHHAVLTQALEAIETHRLNALIVPGDILDQHAASRFTKYKDIPLADEVAEMAGVLKTFSSRVERVVITQGNHDMRAARLIAQQVPQLSVVLKTAVNFLDQCANGLTNVTPMASWWVKIGNVVFCHREKYTKQERTSGESNLRYFENRGVENIGLIVQGHVHRTCYFPLKRGVWYMENPASCYRPDYTYESRSLDAILTMGYSMVTIRKNGCFDPNATRPFFTAWE